MGSPPGAESRIVSRQPRDYDEIGVALLETVYFRAFSLRRRDSLGQAGVNVG